MSSALDETLEAFTSLMEEHAEEPASAPEGTGNFRCEHCVACHDCRFCTECDNCRECTYCYGCADSLSLTQCRTCDASEKLSHSDLCAECINSSYLTLCVDCEDCVQCFGCVGLVGEEFCILNEKLPRKEYFSRVKEMRAELDRRVREGWEPPWREAPEPEPPQPTEHTQPIHIEPLPVDVIDTDPPVEPEPIAPPTARRSALMVDEPTLEHARLTPLKEPGEDRGRDPHIPTLTRPAAEPDDSQIGTRENWRDAADPPLHGELPPRLPELPPETDDSGVWAAKMFEHIPPPPPYVPEPEASRDGPTRLYAPLDEQPTLTRGTRPVPRGDKKPGKPARRVSIRRARRPTRD